MLKMLGYILSPEYYVVPRKKAVVWVVCVLMLFGASTAKVVVRECTPTVSFNVSHIPACQLHDSGWRLSPLRRCNFAAPKGRQLPILSSAKCKRLGWPTCVLGGFEISTSRSSVKRMLIIFAFHFPASH